MKIAALVLSVTLGFSFASSAHAAHTAASSPAVAERLVRDLAALVNETRERSGLRPLTVNPALAQAAQLKAEHMARMGYFAHTSPEGLTPWYWFAEAGYRYEYAGENLAVNFTDPSAIAEAWRKSPSHRANVVHSRYTEIGTGVAKGVWNGKEAIFVAQVYANPSL